MADAANHISRVEPQVATQDAAATTKQGEFSSYHQDSERAPPAYNEHAPGGKPISQQPYQPGMMQNQDPNMITPLDQLGDHPAWIYCPFCHTRALTTVAKKDSSWTNVAGVLCCLFGGIICTCIPCLCGWFPDVDHKCSNCNANVTHQAYSHPVQVIQPVQMMPQQQGMQNQQTTYPVQPDKAVTRN